MSLSFTFTSANCAILVNDKTLTGVFKFDVSQGARETDTYIKLQRHIIGSDEVVNEMRTGTFSFKLLNNSSSAGYVSEVAEVHEFEMHLSKEDDGKELLLTQTIIVKASRFFFVEDARSEDMKTIEEEDLVNLIKILKKNQEKAKEKPTVVLPEDRITFDDPQSLLQDELDLKDKKKKKKKKNKKGV